MKSISFIVYTLFCASFISSSFAQPGFVSLDTILQFGEIRPMYFSSTNFVGDTIEGYEAEKILLTAEAASALSIVEADLLPKGFGLKILDGYRPQTAVDHFLKWSKDASDTTQKPLYYPHIPKDQLFGKGYIAERSGHSRGSAVDVTLFDLETGNELDMGSRVDRFGKISHPQNNEITKEQRRNREILRKSMFEAGFAPIETEWWHFILIEEPFPDTYFKFPVK